MSMLKGDCLLILDDLLQVPNASIDCIITDPPYNISKKSADISRKETTDIKMDFGIWDNFRNPEEFKRFTLAWYRMCAELLKDDGWIYIFFPHQKHHFFSEEKEVGIYYRTIFTWIKSNPPPSYRKYNWTSATETIWIGSKGMCRIPNFINQPDMRNHMTTPAKCNYGATDHPTEKPVELIERFILASTNEGDVVLDPFMGSGSIGVACKELGRNFIGIERDPKWYKVAKERIKNTECLVRKVGDDLLI